MSYHYNEIGDDDVCKYSAPSNGGECQADAHCITNTCNETSNLCIQGTYASDCYENSDCLSNNCNNNDLCGLSTVGNGGYCSTNTDCNTLNCNTSTNLCSPGDIGSACADNVDCISNACSETNTCVSAELADEGEACTENSDCNSSFCKSNSLCADPDDQLLAVGKNFTCFAIDGAPKCFGKNNYGQLGNGTTDDNYTPVAVVDTNGTELSNIIQLSASEHHACALNSDGEVYCWGRGGANLYADGNSADKDSGAVKISGITATKISTSIRYTCAVTSSGELMLGK